MALPDYPLENKIEKISIYKDGYALLIAIITVFSIFDFFVLKNYQLLHIFNGLKIFILIALHPFFKKKSTNSVQEEQIRILLFYAFSIPINIFFAFVAYDQIVNLDNLVLKKLEYYSLQFLIYSLVGITILRFDLKNSFYLNFSSLAFYIGSLIYLKKLYYGIESDLVLLFQIFCLVTVSSIAICINYYLDKFHLNQNRLEEQTYFWKTYSEDLVKKTIPKTFYFQNICLLYFDITGIANYFRSNGNTSSLDSFLKLFFEDTSEFCKQNKIELHNEEGKYWFLILDHPANTNIEYADPIADLALFMQNRFKRICAENNFKFDLRMGISSGKYVDFTTNAQKLDIFYLNTAFTDASNMEKFGINGEIQVTEDTYKILKTRFSFIKRGSLNIHSNKEDFRDYYLLSSRA